MSTPSTRRTWLRTALVVAAVVVGVPLAAGLVFIWSFSGGWDGIRPSAQPLDSRVVAARDDSVERTRSRHDDALRQVIAATGGRVLDDTEVDTCTEGHNDWKRQDGYTLSCDRTAASALQLPPSTSFTDAAGAVERALLDAGWAPDASRPYPTREGDESVLRFSGGDPGAVLEVAVSTRAAMPIYLPQPVYADWAGQAGDVPGLEQAFAGGTGVRLLVVTRVTYFHD